MNQENKRTQEYLSLLERSLTHIESGHSIDKIDFSKDEALIIQDYFSYLTAQIEDGLEDEIYIEMFRIKIERFAKADRKEWSDLLDLLHNKTCTVSPEQHQNFRQLMIFFHEKSIAIAK